MKKRDTFKYRLKDGNKIVYFGITNDLKRRYQEHLREGLIFTSMEKVGNVTTYEAACKWEEDSIRRYKEQHNGHRPRYNNNDSGK